jgi:prephenate dehydrogenase
LTIAIVGRGLIGGSIALALARLRPPPEIVTLDRGDDLNQIAGADIIFLAAPIPENIRILTSLPSQVPGEALITDTGSTKRTTVAAAETLPSRLRFIGGHPIAGAATIGAAAARGDLFQGRPWILTPSASTPAADVATLIALIESLGARPALMDTAEHDRIFAFVSHLPQLAVSALMQTVGSAVGESGLAIAGTGLRDSSRLAASPAALWRDIVESNGDHVDAALDQLIATLRQLRTERDAALPRIFDEAARWKQVLERERRS